MGGYRRAAIAPAANPPWAPLKDYPLVALVRVHSGAHRRRGVCTERKAKPEDMGGRASDPSSAKRRPRGHKHANISVRIWYRRKPMGRVAIIAALLATQLREVAVGASRRGEAKKHRRRFKI